MENSPTNSGSARSWADRIWSYQTRKVDFVRVSEIPARAVDWLIPQWLARGKVHELVGPPGIGKGQLWSAMAAWVSRGGNHASWPDQTSIRPGIVAILTAEDNGEDTVRPRLEAAGASLERILFISSMREFGRRFQLTFDDADMESLEAMARSVSGIDLLVIDPAGQAMNGDSSKNFNAQRSFERLGVLSARLNCATLCVSHTVKTVRGRSTMARVAGPLAIGSAPRGLMIAAKIESGPSEDGARFVLVRSKFNSAETGGGFAYDIAGTEIAGELGLIPTSKIVWKSKLHGTADELLKRADSSRATSKVDEAHKAEKFLKAALRNGPLPCPEIKVLAREAGVMIDALRKAKASLGIRSKKQTGKGQFSAFAWGLPEAMTDGKINP